MGEGRADRSRLPAVNGHGVAWGARGVSPVHQRERCRWQDTKVFANPGRAGAGLRRAAGGVWHRQRPRESVDDRQDVPVDGGGA